MKNSLILFFLFLVNILYAGTYSGGDGTAGDPYQINNTNDLIELSNTSSDWGDYFIQTASIIFDEDETEVDWNGDGNVNGSDGSGFSPIGNSVNQFTGQYNGNKHTVINLFINRSTTHYIGLFGYISGASISEIGIVDCDISGNNNTGSLVGNADGGSIQNSYATGTITGVGYVGGLAGSSNSSGSIENSFAIVTVNGIAFAGGLLGYSNESNVVGSFAIADVHIFFEQVGGLIGNSYDSTIEYCYSVSNVSCDPLGGGVLGGLIGYDDGSTLTSNYWETDGVGGLEDTGNNGDVTGINETSNANMKNQSTYSGWDFGTDSNDWIMSSSRTYLGYPTLRWTDGYAVAPTGNNISSVMNLVYVAESNTRWAINYTQTADLNMWTSPSWHNKQGWTILGNSSTHFTGDYNGNGYEISNLYINRSGSNYIGLFGYADGSTISNIGIVDCYINGNQYVGGLLGYCENSSSISGSYATGFINSANNDIGGLVGYTINSSTTNSYAIVNVNGAENVGGLIGYNNDSFITNSFASGDVSGNAYVGGLVGYNTANITDCYAMVNVTRNSGANTEFGGFCGINVNAIIENCYSSGKVYSSEGVIWNVGGNKDKGFVGGTLAPPTYVNNFFDTQSSEQDFPNPTGYMSADTITSLEMKTQGTFTGWDFTNGTGDWSIENGEYISYPYIQGITYDAPGAAPEINPIPGLMLRPPIFVKHDATGNNDGSSWADAFNSLQDALDNVTSGDEIWVAAGTYFPEKEYDGTTDEPRKFSFQMKNEVEIYGGFHGNEDYTIFDKDFRDFETDETILSGDIGITDDSTDNCYHVISNPGSPQLDSTAIIDGFTITEGNADGSTGSGYNSGGAIKNEFLFSPVFSNLNVVNNYAKFGAGMYNIGSSPTLINVTFRNNNAFNSGAVYNYYSSSPTMNNVTIDNNTAVRTGGIFNLSSSSPILTNVTISNNSSENFAGGIANDNNSSPTLNNVTIENNSGFQGGGIYNEYYSDPELINVIINNNSSSYGGGIYNTESSPQLTNVLIINNEASNGGGIYNHQNSSMTLNNVTISNNSAMYGGGITNITSSPTFNNCIIWGNTSSVNGNQLWVNGTITFNYSCFANGTNDIYDNGGTLDITNNNITNKPFFIDPDSDDFRIFGNSPCVNTGNDLYNSESYDIRGEDRIQGTQIDMGAYEWTSGVDAEGPILTLSTSNIQILGDNKAKAGGYNIDDSDETVTAKGICWNTTGMPTLSDNYTVDGGGDNDYQSIMNGLSVNTQYYVRAYATNSFGTGYGNEITFIYTAIPTLPEWGLIIFGGLIAVFAVRKFLIS